LGATAVLVVLVLLGGCAGAWWRVRRRQANRDAARRRDVVGELLSALVAELRSGAEPRAALVSATNGLRGLEPMAAAAVRPAGDVPAALDALADRPGGSTAGDLAAAWRVADLTGCGLADPVARVLRGHRSEDRLRREVGAQLAGPRATAALLSGLPLVGLMLGIALGADPVGFLLGPTAGRLVLVVGIALVAVGIIWTRRITAAALADFLPGLPRQAGNGDSARPRDSP
jgi:tight adherence protein B